jgi:hypothetical protein
MRCVLRGLDKVFGEGSGRRAFVVSHPRSDETAARMGHPGFIPGTKKTKAPADLCGMTNKRTDNGKSEMRGFFAPLRMTEVGVEFRDEEPCFRGET